MQHDSVDDLSNDEIGHTIREELARRRMSRQALADEARISISTLEKALSGRRPFTLATVIRLEEALGLSLRHAPEVHPAPVIKTEKAGDGVYAPQNLGGYARASAGWLEGRYYTLRPSFGGHPDDLFSYLTTIRWDPARSHLVFEESQRVDASFSQKGEVSFPFLSGHIYLVTNVDGQYRMAVMGRPAITGTLYGILTSLMAASGSHLLPVSVPLVMIPLKDGMPIPDFGSITPGHVDYAHLREELDAVTGKGFARFPR